MKYDIQAILEGRRAESELISAYKRQSDVIRNVLRKYPDCLRESSSIRALAEFKSPQITDSGALRLACKLREHVVIPSRVLSMSDRDVAKIVRQSIREERETATVREAAAFAREFKSAQQKKVELNKKLEELEARTRAAQHKADAVVRAREARAQTIASLR